MAPRGTRFVRTVVVAVIATLLLSVLIAGCAETPEADPPPDPAFEAEPAEDGAAETPDAEEQAEEPGAADEQTAAEEGTENVKTIVKIKTGKGDIVAELYDEKMPITAGNFLLLIDDGFYSEMTFHRVVPDFVIQGGDPSGDGTGGPDWAIPLEKPGAVHHERGILSMARAQPLDSAGSQFFVCLSNNQSVQSLDSLGGGYAAFGKVTEGMDVVDSIGVGDALTSIEIVSESEHAGAAREASLQARIALNRGAR
ncbi:MAG: peptidylprolyl isomerase [Armatimonadota bacterium]|jgi:peptidyl-prolyl cis-trans isomerase B (cyclophilin B)